MTDVVVLGASGMLGSMLSEVLSRDRQLRVTLTARSAPVAEKLKTLFPEAGLVVIDALAPDIYKSLSGLPGDSWIINAIGITKPLVHDDNALEVERAILINSVFPHELGRWAGSNGSIVLQIATDCVYSGAKGAYGEENPHDALDVYGKTKSLGEVNMPCFHHLRCSIIGPEPKEHKFLLDWFLGQPRGSSVNGFTNHLWNGVTSLQFARLCAGIVKSGLGLPHMQHVVPANVVTKAEMLKEFAKSYGREDISVKEVEAGQAIDRTLGTSNPDQNALIWTAGGYVSPPTVQEMVAELSAYTSLHA